MNKEEISKRIDKGLQILKQEPSFIFNMEEIESIQYLQNEIIDIQKTIDFYVDKKNIIFKEELKTKQTILNLISKLQKELDKKDKVIKELENKLEEHIKFCKQEASGHIENNVCHISLKFEKRLLEEIKKVEGENV